jgi:rare lipoprotein A (peptidoglycan hydrolase)
MIECDRTLSPGAAVKLDLEEAGLLEAEVRWCQRGQIGLQFREEFSLSKLAPPKRAASGLTMLKPQYLERQPEAAEPGRSPVAKRPVRR